MTAGQAYEKKPNSPVTLNRPAPGMLLSAIAVARAPAVVAKRAGKPRTVIGLSKARRSS